MTGRSPLACLVLTAMLLGGAPWLALPPAKEKWTRAETPNLVLLGNAKKGALVRIGRDLELLRGVLVDLMGVDPVHAPIGTTVFVFDPPASFASYDLPKRGRLDTGGGYFIGTIEGNLAALTATADTEPSPIYHAYVHTIVRSNFPRVPLWLDEGLAELFSMLRPYGGGAEIGRSVDHHQRLMADQPPIPFEHLFSLGSDARTYDEGARRGPLYAQSWALVHYLIADERRRAKLPALLDRFETGASTAEALQATYGIEVATIESLIEAYAKADGLKEYRHASAAPTGSEQVRALEHAEVLWQLGELLSHHPARRAEDAIAHLEAALQLEPSLTSARVALARTRISQGRFEDALKVARQAVTADEQSPAAPSILGHALLAGGTGAPEGDAAPPRLDEARQSFRHSLGLEPDCLPSLIGLGHSYRFGGGEPAEAIAALDRAFDLLPGRTDLLADLIVLMARSGDPEGARARIDGELVGRGTEAQVLAAEGVLEELDLAHARELLQSGQLEPARTLMRDVADRTGDAGRQQSVLAELIGWVSATVPAETLDTYNLAMSLANEGRRDEARAALERLLGMDPHPDLARAAAVQLERVETQARRERLAGLFDQAMRKVKSGDADGAIAALETLLAEGPDDALRLRAEQFLLDLRNNNTPDR